MPSIDYHQLRSQLSMRSVLDLLGWAPLRRRGDQWRGSCPLPNCPNTHPCCLSVNVGKQVYRCFDCGSHGNVLEFWAAAQQLQLNPAAIHLCERLGLPVPLNPAPPQRKISQSPNQ
jgi:DNA primase